MSAEVKRPDNEWTVMFLFAGDNALAPLIVSQVKAIKDAGFHENIDVLVHFDPNERGVPTKLLHVNRERRKKSDRPTVIGSGADSFVRNMREDIVRSGEIKAKPGTSAEKMEKALQHPDKVGASEALENFLGYCRERHRARNYVLFLVGHGLVVGNNAFLPDDDPPSAVTLPQLDRILRGFTDKAKDEGGALQLLALHSCAMSAIEVAYQLRGTARFMIGSEGIAYVGGWPYQNLLVKLFNTLEDAKEKARRRPSEWGAEAAAAGPEVDVRQLVEKLYFHSMHNATDFMLAGYSLDLALCSLEPEKYVPLKEDIRTLVARLKRAVRTERGRELILLAHWESQSYWDENYTDLYDFCLCLERRCASLLRMLGEAEGLREVADELRDLGAACRAVMGRLDVNDSEVLAERFGQIVVHSDSFGSKYQYSRGLSVYFPWSRPLDDEPAPPAPVALQTQQRMPEGPAAGVLKNYGEYEFSKDFGDDSWLSFLQVYFKETERKPREVGGGDQRRDNLLQLRKALAPTFHTGALSKPAPSFSKPAPSFGDCSCPSIKNYPTEPVTLDDGREVEVKRFSITDFITRWEDR